ncbi:MAG: hypothetical protein HYV97_04220 [Bdellovibrio sp.]|nr:hypothetical protein [Bdellovibrio sp.]
MRHLLMLLSICIFPGLSLAAPLEPKLLQSPYPHQVMLELPLGYKMLGVPSRSFALNFKKGQKRITLDDVFLSADQRSLIVTGFIPSKSVKGKYRLSGIFYQSSTADGYGIQGNCQVWYFDPFVLSCYDNGDLLPYTYSRLPLKVEALTPVAPPIPRYENLVITAKVTELASGEQKVKVSVSSSPMLFEYYTDYVEFGDYALRGNHAYFYSSYLTHINTNKNILEIEHLFSATTLERETVRLRGLKLKSLSGRNKYGQIVALKCDEKSGKLILTHGTTFEVKEQMPLDYPCPVVE